MRQSQAPAPPDGVLSLLRALRARVRPQDAQTSLKTLLPAYERLLRPDTSVGDRETRMMHKLQRMRDVLKSEPDIFDVTQVFDACVDTCLELDNAPRGTNVWSMSDALRMLLALAGGDDGLTFVLEDPTRVHFGSQASLTGAAATRRLGERIRMSNVDIIAQTEHTLLRSTALPLAAEDVLRQYDFASFAPRSAREATFWYPNGIGQGDLLGERDLPTSGPSTMLDSLFQQMQASNAGVPRLIDIPPLPYEKKTFGSPTTPLNKAASRRVNPSPSGIDTEVFFFDASKVIKALPYDLGDDSECVTEASSKSDEDTQSAISWSAFVKETPPVASWEELGVDPTTSKSSIPPLPTAKTDPLRRPLTLSNWRTNKATTAVEVDDADMMEYVAKALCGIESVVFRRDLATASLRLPRNTMLTMATATPSSLMSILEEFRVAGTAFMRVEYLSVYYAQDPSRGGKTCQALADALKLYLSAYQTTIMDQLQTTGVSSCFVSLIATLSKTRFVRTQLLQLSDALKCASNVGSDFWRLLSGGEFPRGVDLLKLVEREVRHCECEDGIGATALLWRWLLVRTAHPFISLVSGYVASGQTPLDLDPHDEFRLSVFSTLQDLEDVSSDTFEESGNNLVPHFLKESCTRIIRTGRLQQMLCSILQQTDVLPVDVLRLPLRVSEAQVQLDHTTSLVTELAKRVEGACNSDTSSLVLRQHLRSPIKSPRSADEGEAEWIAIKRKRLEVKHAAQKAQREMLDVSVRERGDARLAEAEADRAALTEAERSQTSNESVQLERGKVLLISKYAPLIADAEDRHRYMKWRRDRAVRLSSSKAELTEMLEREQHLWRTARNHSSTIDGKIEIANTNSFSEDQRPFQNQDADVVMDDTSDSQEPMMASSRDSSKTAMPTDIIGDGGLLWRPRIRVQNVPGGGGKDAMAMLYPDRDSAQARMPASVNTTQRSSVVITKPGRSEGSAVYESIYGGSSTEIESKSHNRSDKDSDQPPTDRRAGTTNAATGEHTPSTCPMGTDTITVSDETRSSTLLANEDIEMTAQAEDEQAVCELSAESEPRPDSPGTMHGWTKPETAKEYLNPALAILHSATTSFLQPNISPDDSSVLHAVLRSSNAPAPALTTPFRSLSDLALKDPIVLIHDFVDRMALQAMTLKLKLKTHLLWLHRVALMSEGLCMAIFTRDLFSELCSDMRVLLALPGRLTTSLALAMIEARTVTSPSQLPSFMYHIEGEFVRAVSSGPSIPSMADVVQNITLNYDISIHLATVLTPRAISKYKRVHQFLLLLRLTEHETKDTWLGWRKSPLRDQTQSASTRRSCDLVLHSAQLLLNAFLETFTNHVLESKWSEFMNGLNNATSVSWLRLAHERFAADASSCCFQEDDQIETLRVVHTLVECAWSLGKLIGAAEKQGESMDAFSSKLQDVARTQAAAMNTLATHLFQLESRTDHTSRNFAKHFLMRLNLNSFFADTTIATLR